MRNPDCHIIDLQREVALKKDRRAYEELFILFYKRMTRFAVTIAECDLILHPGRLGHYAVT